MPAFAGMSGEIWIPALAYARPGRQEKQFGHDDGVEPKK